jgi:hypothetical protein
MLDLVDMHRPPQRTVSSERAGTAIDPILCARCAEAGALLARQHERP